MNTKPYESYKEIHFQYLSMKKTLDYVVSKSNLVSDFFDGSGDVVFVACGSSYWMSLSASQTLKTLTGKPTFAVKAGDVVMCPDQLVGIYQNPVIICPSRSGMTKECLDAIDFIKSIYQGVRVLSITEYNNCKLEAISDLNLHIPWANETSVCQTQSFSNLYVACLAIAATLGKNSALTDQLYGYFEICPSLYREMERKTREIADISRISGVVTLGCGFQYGAVIEGAYIVIEMAEYSSNYYQTLEYRHGPIVTADEGTVVFICCCGAEEFESKMALEIKETGAKVYAVSNKACTWADYTFSTGELFGNEVVALFFVNILQSFAYHLSLSRGKNPDSPGQLVPFITY